MAAGKYNIVIEAGADFIKTLSLSKSITDSDFDLTNYDSCRGQLRVNHFDDSAAATFAFNFDSDRSTGTIYWSLSNTITSTLQSRDHVYDIELVKNDGTITRLLEGKAEVRPNITRG